MSDSLSRAMNATPRARISTVFGQLEYDVWDCVLVKGVGKEPFDSGQHSEDALRTAIDMSLIPLPGSPIKQDITRGMIAESDEWAKVVLPSLKAINADLRSLKGKFVQVKLVPTGRKYTNKQGEEKENTTFSFEGIFENEIACRAAADAFFKSTPTSPAAPAASTSAPSAVSGDAKRTLALKFVPRLWSQAKGDLAEFEKLLAANSLTSTLTSNDADVLALLEPVAA